jgi:hypothetical protein
MISKSKEKYSAKQQRYDYNRQKYYQHFESKFDAMSLIHFYQPRQFNTLSITHTFSKNRGLVIS